MLLAHLVDSQVRFVDHPPLDFGLDHSLNFERSTLGPESFLADSGVDGLAADAKMLGGFGDGVLFGPCRLYITKKWLHRHP